MSYISNNILSPLDDISDYIQSIFVENQNESYSEDYFHYQQNQEQIQSPIKEQSTKETLKNKKNTNKIESENSKYIYLINNSQRMEELKKDVSALKKKRKSVSNRHDKFSDDIVRRKVKHLVLKNLLNFINDKISEKYKSKIGRGVFIKKLLTINQKQKANILIQFNQEFLYKSICEIFSENISTKYTNYHKSHNKNLIENLLNDDEDIDRKKYFNNLFNLTFLDCLKHFRGSEYIEELIGLKTFDSIKTDFEDDVDYLNALHYHIMNFENIINKKRVKKRHAKDDLNEN